MEDVAYWTSRSDKYKIACRGVHTSYCDEKIGMIPHCHGWGKFRFCHSHPGGDDPHDHMHNDEYALNTHSELNK
jgi:hypothetical protein